MKRSKLRNNDLSSASHDVSSASTHSDVQVSNSDMILELYVHQFRTLLVELSGVDRDCDESYALIEGIRDVRQKLCDSGYTDAELDVITDHSTRLL